MKMRIVFIGLLCMFCMTERSGAQNHLILWPALPPGQTEKAEEPVVSPNVSGNVLRFEKVTQPLLEVYIPNQLDLSRNNHPGALIVCPGGGYSILAMDLEGREVASFFADQGFYVFVLQYRVPKNRNGAFQDVQRAIRLVKGIASKYGQLEWQVGVLGFSAGGHLAASAAFHDNQESYTKLDEYDELSARPDYAALIYPAYLDDGPKQNLSPDLQIPKDAPPVFIFGTMDDPFANDALVLAKELNNMKLPVEIHMLPHGGHGYGLRAGKRAAEEWPILFAKWKQQFH